MAANRYCVFLRYGENIPEYIVNIPQATESHFETVKMVNFMLCAFHLNVVNVEKKETIAWAFSASFQNFT